VGAFQQGNPERVWNEVQRVLELTRGLVVQAARERFLSNFGTPRCFSCQGLHAGPEVLATCLQLRQCYFANLQVSDTPPKQLRVIESILKKTKVP
jgi:hypothetical protein